VSRYYPKAQGKARIAFAAPIITNVSSFVDPPRQHSDTPLTRIPGGSAAISPAENDVEFLRKKQGEKQ
jgi:hypothetical protein